MRINSNTYELERELELAQQRSAGLSEALAACEHELAQARAELVQLRANVHVLSLKCPTLGCEHRNTYTIGDILPDSVEFYCPVCNDTWVLGLTFASKSTDAPLVDVVVRG